MKCFSSLSIVTLYTLISFNTALAQAKIVSIEFIDIEKQTSLSAVAYEPGKVITFEGDLSKKLGIVVNLTEKVPSLKMRLGGSRKTENIEKDSPYSLFKNDGDTMYGVVFKEGNYRLSINACSSTKLTCNQKLGNIKIKLTSATTPKDLGIVTRFEVIHVNTNPQPYKKLYDLVPDANGLMTMVLEKGVQPTLLAKFSIDQPFGVKFIIKQKAGNGMYTTTGVEKDTPYAVWGNIEARLIPWRKVRKGTFELGVYSCASNKDRDCKALIQNLTLKVMINNSNNPTPTIAVSPTAVATAQNTPRPESTVIPTRTSIALKTATAIPSTTVIVTPTTVVPTSTPSPVVTVTPKPSETAPAASGELRKAATAAGMYIGYAVQSKSLDKIPYKSLVQKEGNVIVAENECKPHMVLKQLYPRVWDFAKCKKIIEFARDNKMLFRFHFMFGNAGAEVLPGLRDPKTKKANEIYSIPKDQTEAFMKEYISKITSLVKETYPNGTREYDVWNEINGRDASGKFEIKKNFWVNRLGEGIIGNVFRWVRAADANAILTWNDYKEYDGACEYVKKLKSQGVPIDAFGFQAHGAQYEAGLRKTMKCFKDAGVMTRFTERDNGVIMPINGAKTGKQAKDFAMTVRLCKDPQYSCDSHVFWGVYDGNSWNDTCKRNGSNFAGCKGAPLLFDENYKKKMYPTGNRSSSAYDDIVRELKK